jgi:hypothetical protein
LTLIFKRQFLDRIVGGKKTATRRASRPRAKPGGIYRMKAGLFEDLPDRIRVLRVYPRRLSGMTSEEALKEGFLPGAREWTGIYRSWDDDQVVWVVEFEYLGPDRKL